MRGKRLKTISIFLCVILLFQLLGCSRSMQAFSFNMPYFGKAVNFELRGDNARKAYDEMQRIALEIDRQLSFYEYGDVAKFNRADGEISVSGTNILGKEDYKAAIEVGYYAYEAVTFGQKEYVDTKGVFSIATKRLRERWTSENPYFPAPELIMRETSGLQNPLLITAKTVDGKYYLEKDVMFAEDGTLDDEHTFVTTADFIDGYTLDKLASIAERNKLISAKITVDGSTFYMGSNPGAASGKWKLKCYLGDNLLCEIAVPANSFVSEKDVLKNSYSLNNGTFIGGIIDPRDGYPTTLMQTYDGNYVQSGAYATKAIVVGGTGAKCDALATAACIENKDFADSLKQQKAAAIIFMSNGDMYVIGDIEIISNKQAICDKYRKITL